MTRKDIARKATQLLNSQRNNLHVSLPEAEELVNLVTLIIAEAVENGETVTLRGFGSFKPVKRKTKTARNISTGQTIILPPTVLPKFTPAQEFCQRVAIGNSVEAVAGRVTTFGEAFEKAAICS